MVRILHVTDTHATAGAFTAFNELQKSTPNLDAAVHTGDVCAAWYEDGLKGWNFSDMLIALGNHDTILKAGNNPDDNDWAHKATQQQLYERYFAQWDNGAVVNTNETWWTKDLNDVLLIGIDQTVTGDDAAKEEEWLNDVFKGCIRDNKTCIVCSHVSNEKASQPMNGTWKASTITKHYGDLLENFYPFLTAPFDIAETHCKMGLKLAFWFTGHWHFDALWDFNTFPVISLNSTKTDKFGDLVRDTTPDGNMCVNMYDYDEKQNTVTVYRFGAGNSFDGRCRKMMVVDCSTCEILNQCMR